MDQLVHHPVHARLRETTGYEPLEHLRASHTSGVAETKKDMTEDHP